MENEKFIILFGQPVKINPKSEPEKDEIENHQDSGKDSLVLESHDKREGEENVACPLMGVFNGIKMYDFLGPSSSSSSSGVPIQADDHEPKSSPETSPDNNSDRLVPSPNLDENMVNLEVVVMAPPDPPGREENMVMVLPADLEQNMVIDAPVPLRQVPPDQEPWNVRKVLKKSDIDSSCRLLIAKDMVETHILPRVVHHVPNFNVFQGTNLVVWDVDTEEQYSLNFKRWIGTNAYVFVGRWRPDFVERRNLMVNDKIGLRWDDNNNRLEFKLFPKRSSGVAIAI